MKENTGVKTQIHKVGALLMAFLLFYFTTLCLKMSLSRPDAEDHRKLERHCFAFLQSNRLGLAPTLSGSKKGKYGVLSLLDVWVRPEMMWVRAWPQHLHKALPVLPPRCRKGQVFPLVSLILKECGVPSDTGKTPIYIYVYNPLIPGGQETNSEFGHILKALLIIWCRVCFNLPKSSEVWSGAESFYPRKWWNEVIKASKCHGEPSPQLASLSQLVSRHWYHHFCTSDNHLSLARLKKPCG